MPNCRSRAVLLVTAALMLVNGACATGRLPLPGPNVSAGILPGFDTRAYPGDAAMRTWLAESPYRWVGYYLPAPCYTGTSWIGRREELASMGWGIAVLFVGEQDWSQITATAADSSVAEEGAQCTRANLTPAHGAADAQRADSTMSAEGFAPGTPVYLDVERMESVTPEMEAYVGAWFDRMLELGRYVPALYAHERNVTILHEVAREAFTAAGRSDEPLLWVARNSEFDVSMRPEDSGILTASIWQGRFDVDESWGGVTLRIDANVARAATPGLLPPR